MLRVAERDHAALEALYDAHHCLVFGIGLRVLGDRASAEDLTQSVFLKLWSDPSAFRGSPEAFVPWLATVARNGGLDLLRRRSKDGRSEIAADVALDDRFEADVLAGLDAQRVRNALMRLPSRERSLIELGYFGGLTHRRLAMETGVPIGTVKTRIRTGLRRLRSVLGEGS